MLGMQETQEIQETETKEALGTTEEIEMKLLQVVADTTMTTMTMSHPHELRIVALCEMFMTKQHLKLRQDWHPKTTGSNPRVIVMLLLRKLFRG